MHPHFPIPMSYSLGLHHLPSTIIQYLSIFLLNPNQILGFHLHNLSISFIKNSVVAPPISLLYRMLFSKPSEECLISYFFYLNSCANVCNCVNPQGNVSSNSMNSSPRSNSSFISNIQNRYLCLNLNMVYLQFVY